MKPKFIIVGSQRTGTTLINESLSFHSELNVTFEALHEDPQKGNTAWRENYNFKNDKDYIRHLFENYNGFKVLYHQLPTSHSLWKHIDCQVVHVTRSNLAEIVVSRELCLRSNIWQNRTNKSFSKGNEPVFISPKSLEEKMNELEVKKLQFKKFLTQFDTKTVKYEEIIDNWDVFIESICKFLKIKNEKLPQTTKKRTKPLTKVLSNFDEHKSYFKGTSFEKFFQTDCPYFL